MLSSSFKATKSSKRAVNPNKKIRTSKISGAVSKSADIPSISALLTASKDKVDAWFRASSTSESYKCYVKEGREWVLRYAQQLENSGQNNEAGWDTKELAVAFDAIGELTPKALHAFVVYKCEVLENGYKTAEGIRSAFKHYFI